MAGLSITGALGSVGRGCLVDLEGSSQLVTPWAVSTSAMRL